MLLKLPYLFQERYNMTRMLVELLRSLKWDDCENDA